MILKVILLNKKRIILFILIIFVSIIIYLVCFNDKENSKIIPVSNINLSKKVVIIDPRSSVLQIMVRKVKMEYQRLI